MSAPTEELSKVGSAVPSAVALPDKESLHSQHAIPKPESIRDLSDEELAKLRKKMVRKMDMVIM